MNILLSLDYTLSAKQSHSDLKPENVLISIDEVENIIQAEVTASEASTPPRIVGVPPSKGRGGNQTPRSESVVISQPLPSPSSSFGSSPMLDKWAFGMSKIEGNNNASKSSSAEKEGLSMKQRAQSTDLAAEVSNVSLDTRASFLGRGTAPVGHQNGPSLLSATKPTDTGKVADGDHTSASFSMSVDAQSDDSSSSLADAVATEKITVKIADLGNGKFMIVRRFYRHCELSGLSNMD